MSNKQWRRPAPGAGDTQPSAADSEQAAARTAPTAPPATSTSSAQPRLRRLPPDYMENGRFGNETLPPGVYRTNLGSGLGAQDMRLTTDGLGEVGTPRGPLRDEELAIAAADSVRFLWQVVVLTSRILQSVQLGDVRKVVAAEFAMPGDIVLEDGTLSRHSDAFKVGEDGSEAEARKRANAEQADTPNEQPTQQAKAARKPRGSSHPLLVLLRIAVQAARLIKQIGGGTNPKVFHKIEREAQQTLDAIKAGQDWAEGLLKGT
jgi:hypothetical protein